MLLTLSLGFCLTVVNVSSAFFGARMSRRRRRLVEEGIALGGVFGPLGLLIVQMLPKGDSPSLKYRDRDAFLMTAGFSQSRGTNLQSRESKPETHQTPSSMAATFTGTVKLVVEELFQVPARKPFINPDIIEFRRVS